jgi:hypothetical protein
MQVTPVATVTAYSAAACLHFALAAHRGITGLRRFLGLTERFRDAEASHDVAGFYRDSFTCTVPCKSSLFRSSTR